MSVDQKSKDLETVKAWLKYCQDNEDILYIGSLMVAFDTYKEKVAEIENRNKDSEISKTIKKIKTLLEDRLFKAAYKKDIDTAVGIFGLKAAYGWQDKKDVSINEGKPIEIIINLK